MGCLNKLALLLRCLVPDSSSRSSCTPRQVRSTLHERLGKLVPGLPPQLHQAAPLEIHAKLTAKQLTSFKEPWRQTSCAQALDTAMMYEAGANAFWLDPGLPMGAYARQHAVPHEQPSVETVRRVARMFFHKEVAWSPKSFVTGRLVWPLTMEAFGQTKGEFLKDEFNSSIRLLGGQTVLLAWYGALHEALVNCDEEMLRMLWECGLTMTLQVQASSERWHGLVLSTARGLSASSAFFSMPAPRSGCANRRRQLSWPCISPRRSGPWSR